MQTQAHQIVKQLQFHQAPTFPTKRLVILHDKKSQIDISDPQPHLHVLQLVVQLALQCRQSALQIRQTALQFRRTSYTTSPNQLHNLAELATQPHNFGTNSVEVHLKERGI